MRSLGTAPPFPACNEADSIPVSWRVDEGPTSLETRVSINPRSLVTFAREARTDIALRIGLTADIDILADIDNDACALFVRAGLDLDLPTEHEVTMAERERWLICLAAETVLIAVDRAGAEVGFAAIGFRDAEPYLDQLSVRVSSMGRGIGTAMLRASMRMALDQGGHALWLTTYNHLSWNRPFYERHGFVLVSPEHCGEELRSELSFERRCLPRPEERVVMRKNLTAQFRVAGQP
jgi:GNAT superfamily N-acetyltransferase